jgi:DNA polymerase-3 subunit delta
MPSSLALFPKHLAGSALAPAYLIAGDEHLLVLEAADALRLRARELGYSERIVLEAGETGFDWHELVSVGQALSLFASRRLVDLRLPGGKPGKEGAKAIIDYCKNPPPDLVLMITCTSWSKQHEAAWSGAVDDVGVFVPMWPLKRNDLGPFLKHRAKTRGVSLTPDAIERLVERTEGHLLAAAQEIDTLALLAGEQTLDAAALDALVADSARFDVFALCDAALAGEGARAVRITRALRAEGDAVPGIVPWLSMQLQLVARVAAVVDGGTPIDEAFRREHVWPARQQLFRAALARGRSRFWEERLAELARVERTGKGRSGPNVDAWVELERLVASVADGRAARAFAS